MVNQVFFSRGEISASLNLVGKAWVKDKFAKCEMGMEKVSAHDFSSDIGMKSSGDILFDIDRSSRKVKA